MDTTKLFERNAANVAFWMVVIWAVIEEAILIMKSLASYTAGMVLPEQEVRGTGTRALLFAGLIVAHIVIVSAAPSLGRCAWVGLIGVVFIVAFLSQLVGSPKPAIYDAGTVLLRTVVYLAICLPLLRFRLVDPEAS